MGNRNDQQSHLEVMRRRGKGEGDKDGVRSWVRDAVKVLLSLSPGIMFSTLSAYLFILHSTATLPFPFFCFSCLSNPAATSFSIFSIVIWILSPSVRFTSALLFGLKFFLLSHWSINKSFLRILGNLEWSGRGVPPFLYTCIYFHFFSFGAMQRNGRQRMEICADDVE